MILPTKHIPPSEALIGVGAILLAHLDTPRTVSGLWERARVEPHVGNFERFVLGTNLLFMIGAVELKGGFLTKLAR